jgi:hypothetical protein
MLDLTDKDSDPFLGILKMVSDPNKRYPAKRYLDKKTNWKAKEQETAANYSSRLK